MKMIDLTGEKFSRLLVLELLDEKTNSGRKFWLCRCDCGNTTRATTNMLKTKHKQSCGCLQPQRAIESNKKRAFYPDENKTRLFRIWNGMINRTTYPSQKSYKDYGGRGISVCDEWMNFNDFKEWSISNGYKDDLTIDRIDNDKNYMPENCRWVEVAEQNNNQRTNINLTVGDLTLNIAQWAKLLGVSSGMLYKRRNRGYDTNGILKEYFEVADPVLKIGKGE